MGKSTDELRRDIERTRQELGYDVDALNEKVNPTRVVDRRVSAAKGRFTWRFDRTAPTPLNSRNHSATKICWSKRRVWHTES